MKVEAAEKIINKLMKKYLSENCVTLLLNDNQLFEGESLLTENVQEKIVRFMAEDEWKFRWGNSRRYAGHIDFGSCTISINKANIEYYTEQNIKDAILHEIAHAISPTDEDHDDLWKEICLRIGYRPKKDLEIVLKK